MAAPSAGARGWRAPLALGLAMGAIAAALIAWSGGFGARTNGEDLYVAFLPKHAYIAAALRAGRFPLWNPFEYCGLPLHGVAQGSALYLPIVAANLVLPPLPAIRLVYDVHIAVFIVLVLAYLVREGLALAAAAGGAAIAIACAFNGIDLGPIDHPHFFFAGVYLLPILLAWDATLAGGRWAPAALALFAGVQWLPGYPEVPVETGLLLAVFAALGPRERRVRRLALAGVLLALGAVLAGAQLVPLGETVAQSVRVDDARTFAFTREFLFGLKSVHDVADQILGRYGAAAVFALLLAAVVPSRRRLAWIIGFLWCTFPLNRPFVWLYAVWPLAGFRFAFGWNMMAAFFAGFLVATGLQALREERAALPRWAPPALAAAVAAFAVAAGAWREGAVALACAIAVWPGLARRGGWAVVLALVLAHAAGVLGRIGTMPHNPAPDAAALAPRAAALERLRNEIPGEPRVAAGPELRAGLTLPFDLPGPDGYEPAVAPRRVARLGRHLGLDGMSWGAENLLDMWHRLVESPGAARALGIGIVAAKPMQAVPLVAGGYRKLADLPGGTLALLQDAPPRFGIVHRIVAAKDEEASFAAVTDPLFDPGSTVVLEAAAPPLAAPAPDAAESVRVLADHPEMVRLAVTLDAPGVLVVRDTWFPGWEARVDGMPAPILRANHAFRALALSRGAHAVELAYRPLSFRLGIALSLAGLVATAIVAALGRPLVRWVALAARPAP